MSLIQQVVRYHKKVPTGKIFTQAKACSLEELGFAYTPGVGLACELIAQDPANAYMLTNKGNTVCVISNGSAVLGLGNLGALASKPVMEGKAMLMNHLAGISATELCINEADPDKLVEIIAACAVSMGAINLEDIKAPDCFYILERLKARLDIPVFHDDQDGTAVVVTAAILNALKLVGKELGQVKLIAHGAGAAMIASLRLLQEFGLRPEQVYLFDSQGLIHAGRTVSGYKQQYARQNASTLTDAMIGADIFLGLSAANAVTSEQIELMAGDPIILALANPEPEILPTLVKRTDAIVGTGRSDFPNQINNCTCFPYLFRAVLDSGAKHITQDMLKAVVSGLITLTAPRLARDYIMPSTFDPMLIHHIYPLVMHAANAKPTDYLKLYQYLLPISWWDDERVYKNKVVSDFLPSHLCVESSQVWHVTAVQNLDRDLIHIFEHNGHVFTVHGALDDIEQKHVDFTTCMQLARYVCAVDRVRSKIYTVADHKLHGWAMCLAATL